MTNTTPAHPPRDTTPGDLALLPDVMRVARTAGDRLLATYSPAARPASRADLAHAGRRNEDTSLQGMRAAIKAIRLGAGWLEEDQETTPLPPGEWWTVDAVEGNVNHVHGMTEWAVSITLLRDNVPVLTAVHQPIGDHTYTAVRGHGAFHNGQPLRTSTKTSLDAAIVATGQAETGQADTYRRIGQSITAMLGAALLVRATVPSTFPMLLVASGQNDVFWQYRPVLPGIAAGVLLVREAGGTASQINGSPWAPGSPDILVTTAALQRPAVQMLSTVA